MYTIVRWWIIAAVSATFAILAVSAFLGGIFLVFGVFTGTLSPVLLSDVYKMFFPFVHKAVIVALIGLAGLFLIMLVAIIRVGPARFGYGNRASKLAKKVNYGKQLTAEEQVEFGEFVKSGVLERDLLEWRVSDAFIEEVTR